MRSSDFKTLTIGVLLGVCVMLAKGADQPPATAPAPAVAPRFQISAHAADNGESIVYVLDNATNKVYFHRGSNSSFGDRQEAFTIQP